MMETYYGYVRTPADAIKLFEACRLGMLPRVQRRLSEKERGSIRSGSVFVWDEREAGMRRWTDGKSWSASRVCGSFLTYKEMEGKRGNGFGGTSGRRTAGKTPDSGRGSDEDQDDEGPDGYRYKLDGLMKQSFSITTSTGQHLHLISYCSRASNDLLQPSTDPALRHVVIPKGMYPESTGNEPSGPATMRGPMHQPMYGTQPQGPPQHQGYPPQYPQHQPGTSWPPSPVATPPYSNGQYQHPAQYPPTTLPPPTQHPYIQGPPPGYTHPLHTHTQYERLPPPQPSPSTQQRTGMPLPQPYQTNTHPHQQQHQQQQQPHQHQQQQQQQHQQHQPHQQPHQHQPSHQHHQHHQHVPPHQPTQQQQVPPAHPSQAPQQRREPSNSPQTQHLQAAAREAAVMIDPSLATSIARTQQGPLPAPGQQTQNNGATVSPSSQTRSISPPVNQTAEGKSANGSSTGNNKVSLSSLLNVPTRSEPGDTNPGGNSANSSPRASSGASINGGAHRNGRASMEARAIDALDKGFYLP